MKRVLSVLMAVLLCPAAWAQQSTVSGGALGGTPPVAYVYANGRVVGPNGGVNTAGTTTAGINEAIGSLFQTNSLSPRAGGGTVIIAPGLYVCSGQICISNAGPFHFRLEGSGKASTLLEYTGTASPFIYSYTNAASGAPGNATMQAEIAHLGVAVANYTNAITEISLTALNESDVDDVLFTLWPILTNNWGSALNYTPPSQTNQVTGLLTAGDNMARVRNTAFWGLARSWDNGSAHSRGQNVIFDGGTKNKSLYPFNAGTGSGDLRLQSFAVCASGDLILESCHWDGCDNCILSAGTVHVYSPIFESGQRYVVIDNTFGGSAVVQFPNEVQGPFQKTNYWQVDGSGNITTADTSNPILTELVDTVGRTYFVNTNTVQTLDTSGNMTLRGALSMTNLLNFYNNVATAGIGLPAIVKASRVTAQSAANASITTYTVGAADSSFEVSMNMNVTASTSLSTSMDCTYTDESNASRTMIFPVTSLSGAFLAGGLVTATGAFETPVMHIRCKAGTTITLFTAAGTFSGVTYTAEGNIKQTK